MQLVLYAVHLSAYTSDGVIANEQAEMLLSDMQSEYEKGNYCICGGSAIKSIAYGWRVKVMATGLWSE